MKKIIAIVGMPGAGKSEVADYFTKKRFVYLRLGQIVIDEIKKRGLEPAEKNERPIREKLRKRYGMAAFAVLNFPKIDKIRGNTIVDGLYSWEEYLAFRNKYQQFYCVAVYASPQTRYQRLADRAKKHNNDLRMRFRSLSLEDAKSRDVLEIEKSNKGGPIAMADYAIINEGSKKELIKNLDQIYRRICAK